MTLRRTARLPRNPIGACEMSQIKMSDRIQYAVLFGGFTVVIAPVVIAATVLAYANPFWFRVAGFRWANALFNKFWKIRAGLVKPLVDKYRTFEILKGV